MATSVDAKLLKQTKFPPEFNQKVDMQKVNVEVMKKWIAGKISEILGSEDDVVIELCFNLLEGSRFPDIKVLQIQLTGFLDKDTAKFCKELWSLCLSAQGNPQGVPKELLEAKKLELIQEKIDAEKAAEEARKRKEQDKTRDRNVDAIRQRERGERGRGRGRGGRSSDIDRRPPRDSRSPPPRRRGSPDRFDYRGPPQRREIDTYIPRGRGASRTDARRRRSPSIQRSLSRSRSRSVTPPRHRRGGRYSRSRSRTPVRRGYGRDRGGRASGRGDDRARSFTPSNTSRSRSPRRHRKRRIPSVSSHSPSPPPRSRYRRHSRHNTVSSSRSRSRSLGRNRRRGGRSRRSPSYIADDDAGGTRADYRKGRRTYNDRRRSRSRSRSYGRAPITRRMRRSSSRSRSPSRQRDRKRHRSIQRYAPAGRRRRNTSSVSPPVEKRRKTADSSGVEESRKPPQLDSRSSDEIRATAPMANKDEEVGSDS
ncbi:hypothetical protein MMC06_005220 [Schaereria dolodes]|nr:hypothetical protein [Schaereria dolodes]